MRRGTPRGWLWAATAGVVSAAVLLAVSELAALIIAPDASPLLAVGSVVIDVVPRPLKEFAIEVFGAAEKIVLLAGLGVAATVAAAAAGVLQLVRRPVGEVVVGIGGSLGTAAIGPLIGRESCRGRGGENVCI